MTQEPDAWIGWRRDFFNGYGDNFYFWKNIGPGPEAPSVLRLTDFIDATVVLTTTYCYRADDSLAFILTVMDSANFSDGNKRVSREGRIYVGRDGTVLKILGQILDDKQQPHPLDNSDWQPMRGCSDVAFYKTAAEVQKAYESVLGDIEGKRPDFTPEGLNWCAKASGP